jgi:hypothetical protein
MGRIELLPLDPTTWLPPDYATALVMPSNIKSLTTTEERVFAHLEDGRTVDITALVRPVNQA